MLGERLLEGKPIAMYTWLAFECSSCKRWKLCGEEMYVAWLPDGAQISWCRKCRPDLKYSQQSSVAWSERYDGQLIAATKTTPPVIFIIHPPRIDDPPRPWVANFCSGSETGRLVHFSLEKEIVVGAVEALAYLSVLNKKKPFALMEELRATEELTEYMSKPTYKIPRLRPTPSSGVTQLTLSTSLFPREVRTWHGFKCSFCQRTFLPGTRVFLIWDQANYLYQFCSACKPETDYRSFESPVTWYENSQGDFLEGKSTVNGERFTITMTVQEGRPVWTSQFNSGRPLAVAAVKDRAKGLIEVLLLRYAVRAQNDPRVAKMNTEQFFHHWKSESGTGAPASIK